MEVIVRDVIHYRVLPVLSVSKTDDQSIGRLPMFYIPIELDFPIK